MRRLLVLVLVPLLVVLAAAPAGAHAELLESDPPADGEATEGVDRIEMTLVGWDPSGPVSVEVTDPAGRDVTAGEPEIDERASTLSIDIEPLAVGMHIVHWHAWADDGDGESEGMFRITVVEAPDAGFGLWLLWIVALAIPAAIFLRPGARKDGARKGR